MAPVIYDYIEDIPIHSPSQLKRISLSHHIAETHSPQAPCSIISLFEHQVLLQPFAPAVEFENQPSISYSRLKFLSSRIADALSAQPGQVIPICLDLSVELLASILGVLSAGAAYVILDPAGSLERNRLITKEVKTDIIITSQKYSGLYSGSLVVENILEEAALRRRSSKQDGGRRISSYVNDVRRNFDASTPAYVIYTSGTTGKPKGVVVSHAAASYGITHFSLRGKSRFLLFFNPIFSAAQRTILATLCKGGCVCMTSKDRLAFSLHDVLENMQIDSLGVTPSMLTFLSPRDIPACLKQITTVGEPVSVSVLDEWADAVEFRVSYGLSECAQLNFTRLATKGDNPRIVGKPTDTTEAFVLVPDTTEIASTGQAGELCLAGPQLSDGYLNRPFETAKAFIANPFGPGSMFRTGDLAIKHSNQDYEILGRLDNQIKLHGQRLEPEEVCAVIRKHLGVVATAVVSANVGDTVALVAAVVPHLEQDWNGLISHLRLTAQEHLPSYMIPGFWLKYDRLPTNPNGKVDINQIRARAQTDSPEEMLGRLEPRKVPADSVTDAVELLIQKAWADVLNLASDRIGRRDSFFALGGNSMQAIRMINNLRKCGVDLGLDALFGRHDLATLRATATIKETPSALTTKVSVPFSMAPDDALSESLQKRRGVIDAYPATPLQEILIGLTLQGSLDYLYQRVWDVRHLDLIRLKLAFQIAFLRSETLRTTFEWTESGLMQIVRDDLPLHWQTLDISLDEYKNTDLQAGIVLGELFFRAAVLNKNTLVVSMHHSLFDFLSSSFIYDDISAIYNGFDPDPRPPFKNFVQKILETDSTEANTFWASYLANTTSTILNFAPTSRKISVTRKIPNHIQQISTKYNVTSSTILYFAWSLVLSKHLDSNDVIFANTISGREVFVEGIDCLDGPTLAVVPRRFQLNPNATIKASLLEAHSDSSEILKHSQSGMRNALRAAGQDKALFDTMINILPHIDNLSNRPWEGIFQRLGKKPTWRTEYTTLEVAEDGDDIEFTLNTEIENVRAEFILDQYIHIIAKIAQEPMTELKSLSIITPTEIKMLDIPKKFPAELPQLLHEGFDTHVRTQPWRVALQWQNEEVLTYRMLDSRANKLARHFEKRGLRRRDFVCLLLEKSPTMIVAILAILKVGAAYVPLSPENPVDRNTFIIDEVGAKILLSESSVGQSSAYQNVNVVNLDELDVSKNLNTPLNFPISGNDIAYTIYTSGSTGKPKGCLISHSAAAAAVESMIQAERRRGGEWRALQFSNYTFDASVLDIFNTLNSGGTLCMAPKERLLSDLTRVMEEMDVTHSFFTPTVARIISPKDAPALTSVSVGGEPLTEDVLRIMAGRRFIQCYGPTETAMVVSMRGMQPGDNPRNLGKPFDTVQVFIVERDGTNLVPYGAIGELCIAGPQVGVGYLNRPDLTAAAFCETSLGGLKRMYRSGDLARWLPDGEIECLGRKDNQVKINGHRIELGEIENAVLATDTVKQCVTIVAEIGSKPQLATFVVFGDTASEEERIRPPQHYAEHVKELRNKLSGLAVYMYPKILLPLGSMPKMPSGKANRKLLAQLVKDIDTKDLSLYHFESFGTSGSANVVPAETEQQRILEHAFMKVLDITTGRLGQTANFLALGGDSITAINLSSLIRKQGKLLAVGDVLKFPQLRDMAQRLKQIEDIEIRKFEAPDISRQLRESGLTLDDVDYVYPCPPGQSEFLLQGKRKEQMWVLMTVRPLRESASQWIKAVERLTETNDILRTTFTELDDAKWVGAVLRSSAINVSFVDVASKADRNEYLDRIWKPAFTFGQPFIKYAVLSWPDGKQEIATKMDHGLYDGTLLRIFASHFKELQHGRPAPEHTFFRDFAIRLWQSNKTGALDYWVNKSNRPTSYQFPQVPTGIIPSATQATFVPIDIQLDDLCNACGVTVPTIFQATFQLWLAKSSKQLDVGFDYLYTGRNIDMPNPQSINGLCANFVPLRSKINPNSNIKDYLVETQDFFWDSLDRGNVSIGEIYNAVGLDRETQGNRSLFLFQPFEPAPVGGAKDGEVSNDMRWVYMAGSQVKMLQPYGLVCEVMKTATGYKIKITVDGRVLRVEDALKGAEEMCEIVRTIAAVGKGSLGVGEVI